MKALYAVTIARSHLKAGNANAYRSIMSAAIRAACTKKLADAYRAAMQEDGVGA